MATSKRDVQSNIEQEWRALLDVLASVRLDAFERPRAVGNWSIKDVLGHIATWDEEELKILYTMARGEELPSYGDPNEWNERAAAQKRAIPLSIILVQLGQAHEGLTSGLELLPKESLYRPDVAERIRIDTWEHYQQHRKDIERWLGNSLSLHGRGPG